MTVLLFLLVGIASGSTAFTLTRSSVFQAPRAFVIRLAPISVGRLVTCPYCMSYWTSLPLSRVGSPFGAEGTLLERVALGGLTWIALAGVSVLVAGTLLRLYAERESP